jgi:NAD(P)-dependent dehydrogenase (short-subunit alcohol dehydrogenase family)
VKAAEAPAERDPGLDLGGRVVILTGSSSGLGAQFARALSDAGARLVLVARREALLRDLGAQLGDPLLVAADVTDPATPDQVVTATLARFGRIDGLVNNAGITNVTPAMRETVVDFRRVLETNLTAPFAIAQAVAKSMRETGGGSIVNVASVVGLGALAPLPEAGYAASKSGLIGLTRELATQWARYGIRVNALAPGAFSTEMTGEVFEAHGNLGEFIRSRVPLARAGRPGEVDSMLRLLLHPSSSYVTGQVIAVDGGLTAC